MDNSEKTEILKHSMDRYDHYYDSVNNKGNLYLSINTFIIGGVITGYYAIKENIDEDSHVILFVWITLLLSLLSLICTIRAILPYLSKKNKSNTGSLLYFSDVANTSLKDFKDRYTNLKTDDKYNEYLTQVHLLSIGLKKKFRRLAMATYFLGGSLITILIIAIKILK